MNYSKEYHRHLFLSREILSMRLNTIHNLYFYQDFFKKMRTSIEAKTFDRFKTQWQEVFRRDSSGNALE